MIVSQAEIEMVLNRRRRQTWLPFSRGPLGELLPCPVEEGELVKLSNGVPFAKGSPRVTIIKVQTAALKDMTEAQARRQGHTTLTAALQAFARMHGQAEHAWVIDFALGDHTAFYDKHRERYLKRKGVGLTDNPQRALTEEPAVTTEQELKLARDARARRTLEQRQALRVEKQLIEQAIARLRAHGFPKSVEGELRLAQRRLEKAERLLHEQAA